MRTLRLREHHTTAAVALTRAELDGLRLALRDTIDTRPTPGADGLYDLRPGSTVGAVTVGELRCLIAPKIPVGSLVFLLSYSLDRVRWSDMGFDLDEDDDLVEAVVPAFVRQVWRALRHGPLHGYRSHEEALPVVRGQIRMADQLRARYRLAPPIEVRYDDFTTDILENRLLRAALQKLGRLRARSDHTARALREFDRALAQVRLVHFHPRNVPAVIYTRLNVHYRTAVELARLILRGGSWDLEHGALGTSAFLIDMNAAFEDFVAIALREALGLTEPEFPRGHPLALDRAGNVRMAPDLSWWSAGACLFVGDIKYKRTSVAGFRHPDLYQLHAYVTASGLREGLLIYAEGEDDGHEHEVVRDGPRLSTTTVDISGRPAGILASIAAVAERITGMAGATRTRPHAHRAARASSMQ